jgi:glycosyltransferase involved in cell wall biosynthesis
MRLIIQIPCLNERDHLPQTLGDLPRTIPGVSSIEVLIIDDGSRDGTAEVAREAGVHYLVRFPERRGLAAAHMAGIDACSRLGADIVLNTDADNQYRGEDMGRLVAPLLAGRADIVIGDRQTDSIRDFSFVKRVLQRWGSSAVRRVSGTNVTDTTSGFRAMNRRAMERLFVHNEFTYTLETIIQAGAMGLVLANVPITTNRTTRGSRLFTSIPQYIRRNGAVILRSYVMYHPGRTFFAIGLLLLVPGLLAVARFLYHWVLDPANSGHIQSLVLGVGCMILATLIWLLGILSDLIAGNRRMLEEINARVRRLESTGEAGGSVRGIEVTGVAPWMSEAGPREARATAEGSREHAVR